MKKTMKAGSSLNDFLDRIELLQGKRVKVFSENGQAKKAIYRIKSSLGEDLRSFKYHGKREDEEAYAEFAFDDREKFDGLLTEARKKSGLVLRTDAAK